MAMAVTTTAGLAGASGGDVGVGGLAVEREAHALNGVAVDIDVPGAVFGDFCRAKLVAHVVDHADHVASGRAGAVEAVGRFLLRRQALNVAIATASPNTNAPTLDISLCCFISAFLSLRSPPSPLDKRGVWDLIPSPSGRGLG